jgi:hypothetical protein
MVRFLLGLLGSLGLLFTIGVSLYFGYRFGKWLLSNDCPYGYKSSKSYQTNDFDYSKLYAKPY